MTTAEFAIAISGISLLISFFLAGWTVYRDAIQKPKFRVSVAVKSLFQQGSDPIGPDVYVEVVNLGPIPNRALGVYVRRNLMGRIFQEKSLGYIIPNHQHVGHTAKGERIEVGDSTTFVFPMDAEFVGSGFSQIGVGDGYGKTHWSSKRAYKAFIKQHCKTKKEDSL